MADSPPPELAGRLDDAAAIAESRDDPERFGVIFDRHFAELYR
jgi:hypothetical protein